jgi:hypothetical protein
MGVGLRVRVGVGVRVRVGVGVVPLVTVTLTCCVVCCPVLANAVTFTVYCPDLAYLCTPGKVFVSLFAPSPQSHASRVRAVSFEQ